MKILLSNILYIQNMIKGHNTIRLGLVGWGLMAITTQTGHMPYRAVVP